MPPVSAQEVVTITVYKTIRIYSYIRDHQHTTILYNMTLYLLYKPYVWICIIIYTYLASILVGSSDPCHSCICWEELISLLSNILHHLKEQTCYIIFMIGCHIVHAVPLLAMVVHINVASRLLVVSASTCTNTYIRRRDWQKNKRNGVLDISAWTD